MNDILFHSVTILFVVFILGVVVYEIYTAFEEKKETSRLSKVDAWEGKEFREEFEVIGISKDCGNIKLRLPEVSTSTPMPAVKPPRMTSESVSSPTPSYPTGDEENSSDQSIEAWGSKQKELIESEPNIVVYGGTVGGAANLSEANQGFLLRKVTVNRDTPDKYTQEASKQMTLENLEEAVKEEIKRMEDWK